VRLLHGDTDPRGPGFREVEIPAPLNGTHAGRPQRTRAGGFVEIPDPQGRLAGGAGLTVHAYVLPTLPERHQAIASRWNEAQQAGWALTLEDGYPVFTLANGQGRRVSVRGERRLFAEVWYSLAAGFDPASGRLFVSQRLKMNRINSRLGPVVPLDAESSASATGAFAPPAADAPVILAGLTAEIANGRAWVCRQFNGKIDSPKIYVGLADAGALHAEGRTSDARLIAHWDFSAEITRRGVPSDAISDVAGGGFAGRCVNQPDRGMTGWNWDGSEEHYVHCPEQYGAIWFHEDSLDDSRWHDPLELTVPAGLRSGTCALRVRANGCEDHIPFVVTPPRGTAAAKILVLLPTLSCLAYANSQDMQNAPSAQAITGVISTLEDRDLELNETSGVYGLSTYDYHLDGRGVQYSSWRRPLLSMRPRYRHEFGSMWQFPADLHLIDWLDAQGFAYDVATDQDLVREGLALLERYKVLVTGTHPEHTSGGMLDAFEDYFASGGRGMYLAANGFYWVTSVHPHKPWLMEVRKGEAGTQAWRARPGEYHHAVSGERGGSARGRHGRSGAPA
jgi:N,N-dimethylformamidase